MNRVIDSLHFLEYSNDLNIEKKLSKNCPKKSSTGKEEQTEILKALKNLNKIKNTPIGVASLKK